MISDELELCLTKTREDCEEVKSKLKTTTEELFGLKRDCSNQLRVASPDHSGTKIEAANSEYLSRDLDLLKNQSESLLNENQHLREENNFLSAKISELQEDMEGKFFFCFRNILDQSLNCCWPIVLLMLFV